MIGRPTLALLAGAALLGLVTTAAAQPVYRCGNVYSQTPCPDGRTIDADARTAGQRAEAARVARDEKRLGDAMARDRRADEAARRSPAAATLGPARAEPAPAAASANLPLKKKAKGKIRVVKPEDFVATVPRPEPDSKAGSSKPIKPPLRPAP